MTIHDNTYIFRLAYVVSHVLQFKMTDWSIRLIAMCQPVWLPVMFFHGHKVTREGCVDKRKAEAIK